MEGRPDRLRNLVESYEFSEDGHTFTMHLAKASSGTTASPTLHGGLEVLVEDLIKNPDQKLYQAPAYLRNTDGSLIDITFPDDYTVVWSADKSLGVSANYMAGAPGNSPRP